MKYRLFLSTKKTNPQGYAPIYFRIFLNGKEVDKSTGCYIQPSEFERKTKRVFGNTHQVLEINSKLNKICHLLDELSKQQLTFSASFKRIERVFNEAGTKCGGFNFVDVFKEYLTFTKTKVDSGFDDAIKLQTYRKQEFMFENIKSFLEYINLLEIESFQVDQALMNQFMYWSRQVNKHSVAHSNKQIRLIKAVIKFGVENGYCKSSNIFGVKLKNEVKPIVYLNQGQLTQLEKINLCGHKLEKIKDVFLFQCYTGFSYIDLEHYSKDWITADLKGNLFIRYYRGKNEKLCLVPLQQEAKQILDKYNHCLPVISNQKYNQNLKLLGTLLNFDIELTTHIGRKTCGSILLNKGVSIFTVKTILGHSSVKTTETHYAELNESGILGDMQQASNIHLADNLEDKSQLKMFA
ncbi:MAG: tyrosine-type recombinase/integrase [Bacteroidia bacterium]|nr:tyrosine-type recombinase/integrase [Bacteroidia bacterium]